MQRLGPLLAAVTDVLNHVHHFRQRFSNTFDHNNILQRKPDPPLYEALEVASGIASTVSMKAHRDVAEGIRALKALNRHHQEVGAALRNSVGRGLTGAAAEDTKKQAEAECRRLEFHLKSVKDEIEQMIAAAED